MSLKDEPGPAVSKDPRVEVALRQFIEQIDRGEPVDCDQFLTRHSQIADQLRSLIAAEVNARKLNDAEARFDCALESTKSLPLQCLETNAPPQSALNRGPVADTTATGLTGQFGRYQIIRAIGSGGMGTVYLALDTVLERHVALKTPHISEDPTGAPARRFFREARAAGNLRHPHLCPIYDFGQIDGKHFITMAYIEGHPLSDLIRADQLLDRQIPTIIRKLALALQAAHDQGIVHRDLKPANIMIDTSGEPIIMDFGLARQMSAGDDTRLTQTGNLLGTPAYMSPEQVEGEPDNIGPATDQYSLGVILYELLSGQLPFQGSVITVLGHILNKVPLNPSQLRPETDQRLEAVCLRMMAKKPSARFSSLNAVADELESILDSPSCDATSKLQQHQLRSREIPESSVLFAAETARIGIWDQVRRSLSGTSWIRWMLLGFGLIILGVVVSRQDMNFARLISAPDQQASGLAVDSQRPVQPVTGAQAKKATAILPPTYKNNLGMQFVLVPKGRSWLGGGGGRPGEKEVVISHDIYLGKYEVTQEEWEKVTGLTPSLFSRNGAAKELVKDVPDWALRQFPVENVTWNDVQMFLERLNERENVAGWVYRLPSATEWEYACRGGPMSDKSESAYDFYFDQPASQLLHEKANADRSRQRPCKVGFYLPNRLGFYDMHGNVWEWCTNPEKIVAGTPGGEARGGGWSTLPVSCTAAYRLGPAHWEGRVGLRVARSSRD